MARISLPDHSLGDVDLEARVFEILEKIGLPVRIGRTGFEDLVVDAPAFSKPTIPTVIEVKSGNKSRPKLSHIRQLDDWVFDLSKEGKVRYLGIQNQGRRRNWLSKGAIQASPLHPAPHKGLLIYNGPLGVPFEDRAQPMLDKHMANLAEKRSFCVMSMRCLLSWAHYCDSSSNRLEEFWTTMHQCMGELPECQNHDAAT